MFHVMKAGEILGRKNFNGRGWETKKNNGI